MKKTILLTALCMLLTACGYTNPEVPTGHEGYIYESPRIFGTGGFMKAIKGPGNYGFSFWNNKTINIDFRPKTYNEKFKILTKDQLNISFKAHAIISLAGNSVKDLVEKHSGRAFYKRLIKEPFRSAVRRNVQGLKSTEVKTNRKLISDAVIRDLEVFLDNKPFHIIAVKIGNIDYPKSVAAAIENKLKSAQDLETKTIEMAMAKKDALIKIEEAKGIAKAQEIINKTLTTNYLQHEAIEAQKKMAGSPNTTIVYIPVGNMGVPLIKTLP